MLSLPETINAFTGEKETQGLDTLCWGWKELYYFCEMKV